MSLRLQASLVLSTYQRPEHLRRSLLSLAHQRDVEGQFEVVVADDGSTDSTVDLVDEFARAAKFPLQFTTHEHRGFWLARSRNNGARLCRSTYLIFSDGDCLFPPDYVAQHLRLRRPGAACSGDRARLDESATERLNLEVIAEGGYQSWISWAERRRQWTRWLKDRFYQAIHHHAKPKLTGCNIGVWRSDFERINGFDEHFRGWGCEDDDLAQRLRAAGVRIVSIVGRAQPYHMWHPTHLTAPPKWRDGPNVAYYLRPNKPTRCVAGLTPPTANDSSNYSDQETSPSPARRNVAA